MRVAVARIVLFLPEARSLKDKRRVVKSLKDRLHNQFNVAAAEVGDNDLLQKAVLGVAAVANDEEHARAVCEEAVAFVRRELGGCMTDAQIEVL